jgi:hypothetical protein
MNPFSSSAPGVLYDDDGRRYYTMQDTADRLLTTTETVKKAVRQGRLRERSAAGLQGQPHGQGRPIQTVIAAEDVDTIQADLLRRMQVPVGSPEDVDAVTKAWAENSALKRSLEERERQLSELTDDYRVLAETSKVQAAELTRLRERIASEAARRK